MEHKIGASPIVSAKFVSGDLIWYREAWSVPPRRIPGYWLRAPKTGYWCFVRLLLPDGSTTIRRVKPSSVTRRDPEETYS